MEQLYWQVNAESLTKEIRSQYWYGQGRKLWAQSAVNQFEGLPVDVQQKLLDGDAIVKNRKKNGKIIGHYALLKEDKAFKKQLAQNLEYRNKHCITLAGDFYIDLGLMANYINAVINQELYKEFGDNILAGSIEGIDKDDSVSWVELIEIYKSRIFDAAEVSDEHTAEFARANYLRFKSAFVDYTKKVTMLKLLEEKADMEAVKIANGIIEGAAQRRHSRLMSLRSSMSDKAVDAIVRHAGDDMPNIEELAQDENVVNIGNRQLPARLVEEYAQTVYKNRLVLRAMVETGGMIDVAKGMALEETRKAIHGKMLEIIGIDVDDHHDIDNKELTQFNSDLDDYLKENIGDITGIVSKRDQYKQSPDYDGVNKYEGD